MSSSEPYLVSSAKDNSYGAINNSQIEEKGAAAENPIRVLIREIRSGKQRLAPVLVYSLIAVVGACLNGFMLGFTSVLVINMSKRAYYVENDQNIQFIGVSNNTIIVINYNYVFVCVCLIVDINSGCSHSWIDYWYSV